MSKRELSLLIGLLVAISVLALLAWRVLVPLWSGDLIARSGPVLTIDESQWETRIHEGDDGHELYGIWVDLIASDDFDAQDFDPTVQYLVRACQHVMDRADAFMPSGTTVDAIQHVDINFDFQGDKGWPLEVTMVVEKGTCIDHAIFGGHDLDDVFGDAEGFSKHTSEELFWAAYRVWGLERPNVSFVNSNGSKIVRVDYEYSKAINHDLATLGSMDLCVFVLSRWTKEMNVLGIKIDPANYTKMEISIVNENRIGFFTTRTILGSANLLLQDARCVLPDEAA